MRHGGTMKAELLLPPLEVPPYCWLIEINSRKVGVHRDYGWCTQLNDRIILFDSEDNCMLLVPILEINAKTFTDFIKNIETIVPDYSDIVRKFPKMFLLKYIFHTSCSGYWPERALAWLIDDNNLQPLFQEELKKFIAQKTMPQAARQQAKKILNSICSHTITS